jgi:hypothetical protein
VCEIPLPVRLIMRSPERMCMTIYT